MTYLLHWLAPTPFIIPVSTTGYGVLTVLVDGNQRRVVGMVTHAYNALCTFASAVARCYKDLYYIYQI